MLHVLHVQCTCNIVCPSVYSSNNLKLHKDISSYNHGLASIAV